MSRGKMLQTEGLNFKFIQESNLVEVWCSGKLLKVVEIDESEYLLTNLMKTQRKRTPSSNVVYRTNRSWWQKILVNN